MLFYRAPFGKHSFSLPNSIFKFSFFNHSSQKSTVANLHSTVILFFIEHCRLFSCFLFSGSEWERAMDHKFRMNGEIGAKSSMLLLKCYRPSKISSKHSSRSENFLKIVLKCSTNDGSLIFVFTTTISLRWFVLPLRFSGFFSLIMELELPPFLWILGFLMNFGIFFLFRWRTICLCKIWNAHFKLQNQICSLDWSRWRSISTDWK